MQQLQREIYISFQVAVVAEAEIGDRATAQDHNALRRTWDNCIGQEQHRSVATAGEEVKLIGWCLLAKQYLYLLPTITLPWSHLPVVIEDFL